MTIKSELCLPGLHLILALVREACHSEVPCMCQTPAATYTNQLVSTKDLDQGRPGPPLRPRAGNDLPDRCRWTGRGRRGRNLGWLAKSKPASSHDQCKRRSPRHHQQPSSTALLFFLYMHNLGAKETIFLENVNVAQTRQNNQRETAKHPPAAKLMSICAWRKKRAWHSLVTTHPKMAPAGSNVH